MEELWRSYGGVMEELWRYRGRGGGTIALYWCSMSYFMWSGALHTFDVLLSYHVT